VIVVLAVSLALLLTSAALLLFYYHGDPWRRLCLEMDGKLPARTPERLVIDVVGESIERFGGITRVVIEDVLRSALSVYSFSNRVVSRFESNETEVQAGDHVMEVRVYLREGILSEDGWGFVPGRMCGNIVFVQLLDDRATARFVFIHELGHYFGLYHERGTYMGHPLCPETHGERFSERQIEILGRWDHPGTEYEKHWFLMKEDGRENFGCGT